MLKYSKEAPYEYVESEFNVLIFEKLQNTDSSAIKIKIFYIMYYIIPCENDEILFPFCLANNYIEILLNEYAIQLQTLLEQPHNSTPQDFLIPVIRSLLAFLKFPDLIENDLYGHIFRIASDILEKRNEISFFDLHVKDVIFSAIDQIGKVDLNVFLESGFFEQILEIIHEEFFFPFLLFQCFYFLGHLLDTYSENKRDLVSHFDILFLCNKATKINDGKSFNPDDDEYIDAFFYFITNHP